MYAGRKKGPGDYNCLHMCVKSFEISRKPLYSFGYLPPRASEQGNVLGLVSVYIYIYVCVQFFFVIERTRDLNYLKFVATDFFSKIISPSAGENSGDSA